MFTTTIHAKPLPSVDESVKLAKCLVIGYNLRQCGPVSLVNLAMLFALFASPR